MYPHKACIMLFSLKITKIPGKGHRVSQYLIVKVIIFHVYDFSIAIFH